MEEGLIQFDLVDIVRSLKRWIKWYVLAIALTLALGITLCIIIPPTYKSSVTLLPNQSKDSKINRFEALASKFGIDSPIPGANFSDFLEPILESKSFLFRLSNFQVEDPGTKKMVRFYDYFKYSGESADLDSLIYLSRVRGMVKFLKKASGVMEVSVTAPTAAMAAGLGNETVRLINQFNQEYNFTNARAHVAFLTDQLASAEGQKQTANEHLVKFLESNRGIDPNTSPSLFAKYESI